MASKGLFLLRLVQGDEATKGLDLGFALLVCAGCLCSCHNNLPVGLLVVVAVWRHTHTHTNEVVCRLQACCMVGGLPLFLASAPGYIMLHTPHIQKRRAIRATVPHTGPFLLLGIVVAAAAKASLAHSCVHAQGLCTVLVHTHLHHRARHGTAQFIAGAVWQQGY